MKINYDLIILGRRDPDNEAKFPIEGYIFGTRFDATSSYP